MSDSNNDIEEILTKVQQNKLSIAAAQDKLKHYDDLGFAKIDLHRPQRQGFPEVVFGEGKTPEQIVSIINSLNYSNQTILITRIDDAKANHIMSIYPNLEHHPTAQIVCSPIANIKKSNYVASIISAGTSDIHIAEEAAITAEVMGVTVKRFYDVGVSGIHRLFENIDDIRESKVSVVVAGMEGALCSVISGLVNHPVYAIPTSIGYGANLAGVSTLLSMINSCAPGTSVLNIDNGFGGGYNAAQVINMLETN